MDISNCKTPMLSVVVPVYKVEREYLKECLDSIDAQTFRDYELLLIDDGAPSDTAAYLDEYAKDKEYIKVYHQPNQGVSVARNLGLANCTGKYVTFIDSDDTITPDNFDKIIKAAEENNLEVLMWGLYRCFGDKKIPFLPYLEDIKLFDDDRLKEVALKCLVGTLPSFKAPASKDAAGSACAKLYKLDFLRSNNLQYTPGLKRAEDMLFNLMVFSKAKRVGSLNSFFYNYRQLSTSATYQYRENGISVFTDTLQAMGKFCSDEGKSEEFMQVYYMRCMFFLLESMDMDYCNKDNPNGYFARRAALKAVAEDEPYKDALAKLKLSSLVITRKIPLVLIRCKMYGLLMLFYQVYGLTRRGK